MRSYFCCYFHSHRRLWLADGLHEYFFNAAPFGDWSINFVIVRMAYAATLWSCGNQRQRMGDVLGTYFMMWPTTFAAIFFFSFACNWPPCRQWMMIENYVGVGHNGTVDRTDRQRDNLTERMWMFRVHASARVCVWVMLATTSTKTTTIFMLNRNPLAWACRDSLTDCRCTKRTNLYHEKWQDLTRTLSLSIGYYSVSFVDGGSDLQL